MQLLLIFLVCVACMPAATVPLAHPEQALWGTGLGLLLVALAADLPARLYARQLWRRPSQRGPVLRRFHRWRSLHLILLVGVYLYSLYGFGWANVVRGNWGLDGAILLDEILILTPFVLPLVLAWASFYRVERAAHETCSDYGQVAFWTCGEYLSFHVRHSLGLVLVPVLFFTGVQECLAQVVPNWQDELVQTVVLIAVLALSVLVVMPWLLTVLWPTHALAAGPVRSRLEGVARRLGFRCTNILRWETHGGMANAMVTGILPWPRYVLLSDSLLENLSEDEVAAVFGHEVGHVRHGHMPLYLTFLVLSLVALGLLGNVLVRLGLFPSLGEKDWAEVVGVENLGRVLVATVGVGGYLWLVFGFLSRRCERQADVFGAKSVSETYPVASPAGYATFIRALERVADLNGIRRDKPSWRHSSIARRVAFLEALARDPHAEPRFQHRLFWVKWAVVVLLGGAVSLLLWLNGGGGAAAWF